MLLAAASFLFLIMLPVSFSYLWFGLALLLSGISMGLFMPPNTAGVMNSLPPSQRGAGAGMLATSMNSASVLSIGVFFTLMIVGLASGLPHALNSGLMAHGVPAADAARVSQLLPWRHCLPRCSATTRWRRCSGRRCCRGCHPDRRTC